MAGMGLFVLLKSMGQRMIESLTYADVGAAPAVHDHDDRYYTEEEVDRIVQDIVAGDLPDRSIPKSKLEKAVQDTLDAADAHIAAEDDAHPASAISYGESNVDAALAAVEQGLADATAASVNKAGDTMTGTLTISGGGVFPTISGKNGTDDSSAYPDGLTMMAVGSSNTDWPKSAMNASALTFVGSRGGGQRIWQLVVEKVLGSIWIRTRNNDDTAWESWRELWHSGNVGADANNRSVALMKALLHRTDTRSTVLTYSGGRLTKVEEKDGSTVVKTTTLNYDGNGRLSSVVETAGGVSRTSTLNYDASGNLISVTRS